MKKIFLLLLLATHTAFSMNSTEFFLESKPEPDFSKIEAAIRESADKKYTDKDYRQAIKLVTDAIEENMEEPTHQKMHLTLRQVCALYQDDDLKITMIKILLGLWKHRFDIFSCDCKPKGKPVRPFLGDVSFYEADHYLKNPSLWKNKISLPMYQVVCAEYGDSVNINKKDCMEHTPLSYIMQRFMLCKKIDNELQFAMQDFVHDFLSSSQEKIALNNTALCTDLYVTKHPRKIAHSVVQQKCYDMICAAKENHEKRLAKKTE